MLAVPRPGRPPGCRPGDPRGRRGARQVAAPHPSRRRAIAWSFGIVAVVSVAGILLATVNASSWDWWFKSASALGTDPTGARYFNLTMVATGIAFFGVSRVMDGMLRETLARAWSRPVWTRSARIGLWVIPFAFMAVGLWRIDEGSRANAIHNVAGFAIPLIVMGMMLTIHIGMPRVFPRFERIGWIILAGVVGLFVVAALDIVSYALMEFVGFIVCWAWLLSLARRLDRRFAAA